MKDKYKMPEIVELKTLFDDFCKKTKNFIKMKKGAKK